MVAGQAASIPRRDVLDEHLGGRCCCCFGFEEVVGLVKMRLGGFAGWSLRAVSTAGSECSRVVQIWAVGGKQAEGSRGVQVGKLGDEEG